MEPDSFFNSYQQSWQHHADLEQPPLSPDQLYALVSRHQRRRHLGRGLVGVVSSAVVVFLIVLFVPPLPDMSVSPTPSACLHQSTPPGIFQSEPAASVSSVSVSSVSRPVASSCCVAVVQQPAHLSPQSADSQLIDSLSIDSQFDTPSDLLANLPPTLDSFVRHPQCKYVLKNNLDNPDSKYIQIALATILLDDINNSDHV